MKLLLLAIFVVAAVASPIPDDDGNIDVIVNGVPEGEALDIAHIVQIQTQETVNGEVVATSNVLHPYTAQGLAETAAAVEAAAAAEAAENEVAPAIPAEPETVIPEAVVLPEPVAPEVSVVPNPIVLPEPVIPDIVQSAPESIVLPGPVAPVVIPEATAPVVVPEAIALPEATAPVVVPEAIVLPEAPAPVVVSPPVTPIEVSEVAQVPESVPEPALLQTGEIFNNGVVSMEVNAPQPTLLDSLQKWFNLVIQYVSDNVSQTTTIV